MTATDHIHKHEFMVPLVTVPLVTGQKLACVISHQF